MDKLQLEQLRHSCAHLLAAAVLNIDRFKHAKLTLGPAIENGFYYDIDFGDTKVTVEDLKEIEEKMYELVPHWKSFEHREVASKEAKEYFDGNVYKHELIDDIVSRGESITLYTSGTFTDLCRGGHSERPSEELKHFKLLSVAGAYWRGNEKNKMLTRIYGTCFPNQQELQEYLTMIEEAKKRDHKKLGPELDLFIFSDLVGSGLPLWTPKGTVVRNLLDSFVWELRCTRGYEQVDIPHITKKELYEVSGHWDKYKDDLFKITTREGHEFAMKPMNCPHHTQIYNRKQWSYRELPQRYASTTKVYRDEQSGELAGLSRVRAITQDDAHVFCRVSQVRVEAETVWNIIEKFYGSFGFALKPRLSRRDPSQPEKYLGSPDDWDKAEGALRDILHEKGVEWTDGPGEAAFYGPKIDFMAKDSIGRMHQVATIQLDFNQPKNFGLTCVNEQGEKEGILMIHCAIMGSIERFLSVLIEHTAGIFPVWLSPVQVQLVPVSSKHADGATTLAKELSAAQIRVAVDAADETVGNKVRKAAAQKIPYIIVVGDKELSGEPLMIRVRGQEEQVRMTKEEFLEKMKQHNVTRQ